MLVIHLFMMTFFLYGFLTGNVPLRGTREEELLLVSLLEFALFASVLFLLDTMRKKCSVIRIRETGITLYPLFCIRGQKEMQFNYYPYLHYAYYLHSSMIKSYRVQYFVFTNKKLTHQELSHINQIISSKDLVKIRYDKKHFSQLIDCMPSYLANELSRIRDTYII